MKLSQTTRNDAAEMVTITIPKTMVDSIEEMFSDDAFESMKEALDAFDRLTKDEQEERDNYVGAVDYATLNDFVTMWQDIFTRLGEFIGDIDHQETLKMMDKALLRDKYSSIFD